MRTTMKPSTAARLWWDANLRGDERTMKAMRARCADVESRCVQCGHRHGGPSIVGPACRDRAMREGKAQLIARVEAMA